MGVNLEEASDRFVEHLVNNMSVYEKKYPDPRQRELVLLKIAELAGKKAAGEEMDRAKKRR